MPAIRTEAGVLIGSEQVPPLSASVTVTVCPAVDALAEQLPNPLGSVTAGTVGIANPVGRTIVSFDPAARAAPLVLLLVKPIVQLARAAPVCGKPAKPTLVTPVAAAITTALTGEAVDVFEVVLTVKLVFV